MLPYLLIGAGAALAFLALLKKKGRDTSWQILETTIVIGGTPNDPKVKGVPAMLDVARKQSPVWHIEYDFDGGVSGYTEVSLRHFKPKQGPSFGDPFEGKESDRKNKKKNGVDPKKIKDKVRKNAFPTLYKYDIYLNDIQALDPDIRIREG